MPFYIFVAANLEKIHSSMLSCQQRELVVVEGESVLLPGKGLPYNGVNLQVPGVDAGDHVGLNWRDPSQEALGGLAMAGPLDLVKGSRDRLELSLPGELVVSDPWVVADNIQVDLLHSGPLPAELGDNRPVRGDGDTEPEVGGICGPLEPSQVDGGSSFLPIVTPNEVSYAVIIFSINFYDLLFVCLVWWCRGDLVSQV